MGSKPASLSQVPRLCLIVGSLGGLATGFLQAAEVRAEEPVELESYVVTGTRTPQSTEVAPVQVHRLDTKEIERLGGRSFADAMQYVPGVQVESNCQSCNTTEIRLLGLDGNYNQLAFDGLPLLSSLAGVYGVEQIPAGFVDRIEVVKGGGSALYGASAVAGIVNIIPREPRRSGSSIDYRFDSIGGAPAHQAGLTVDRVSDGGRSIATVFGQLMSSDPVDLNGDGYTELARRRMETGAFRGRLTTDALVWTIDVIHTREYRRGGNRLGLAPHLANIAEQLETDRTAATISAASPGGGDVDFRAALAAALTRRDSYYGGLGDIIIEPIETGFDPATWERALAVARRQYGRTQNPLYVADLQVDHHLRNRTLSWGLQAEYEMLDDRNLDDTGALAHHAPLRDSFSNIALFLQDDWTPRENLTLLTGARLDRNDRLDSPVLSPRLSVRHAPNRHLVVRGSVATGFRSPRIFDEDLHVDTLGAEPIRIINAPDLKKEGALTTNIGVAWNPPAQAERLAFETNLFAARITDVLQLSALRRADDGTLFQERYNAGGMRVFGAELNAACSLSPTLRADFGLAVQRARFDDAVVIFDDGAGRVIATDRLNKSAGELAVFRLLNEDPEGIDWALGVRFIGPTRVLNKNAGEFRRVPAFTVVDVSVGRHLAIARGEYEWRVGVQNLTDARQRDLESGASRDSDYVYGPRQPRTFFAQIHWRY